MKTVAIDTALVTENMSLMLSTLGSQMEPKNVPTPAVRVKPLSEERHVPGGSTVTVTACTQNETHHNTLKTRREREKEGDIERRPG